jgi:hypothetical protein
MTLTLVVKCHVAYWLYFFGFNAVNVLFTVQALAVKISNFKLKSVNMQYYFGFYTVNLSFSIQTLLVKI